MGVAEMLARMDSRELSEWMAYYSIDPFGEQRADLRAGIVAAATVNCHRAKGRAVKPSDFMPFEHKPNRGRKSLDQMRGLFKRAAAAFNRVTGHTQ